MGGSQRSPHAIHDYGCKPCHRVPPLAKVRVLLSFREVSGAYSRGYAAGQQAGIACHDPGGWRLSKLFKGGADAIHEFRQAGSANADAMRAMQDMAADGALDAQGEREGMRKGWRD